MPQMPALRGRINRRTLRQVPSTRRRHLSEQTVSPLPHIRHASLGHDASQFTVSNPAGPSAPVVRAAATTATDFSDLGALIRDSLQQQPRRDTEPAAVQTPPVQGTGPDLGAMIRDGLQQQPQPDPGAASGPAPPVQETGPDLGAKVRDGLQQQPQPESGAASGQAPPVQETVPDLGAMIRDSLQQQPRPDTEAASGQAPPVLETGPPDVPQPPSQAPEVPQATPQAPEIPQPPSRTPEVPQSPGNAATEAAKAAPSNEMPTEASKSQAQDVSPTMDSVPNEVPSSGMC